MKFIAVNEIPKSTMKRRPTNVAVLLDAFAHSDAKIIQVIDYEKDYIDATSASNNLRSAIKRWHYGMKVVTVDRKLYVLKTY